MGKAVARGHSEVANCGAGWAKLQLASRQQLADLATDHATQCSSLGGEASKPLGVKICGGCGSGRNSQPHRRVHWRDPQGPRMYTNPPTWELAPEGPHLMWVAGEVTESQLKA